MWPTDLRKKYLHIAVWHPFDGETWPSECVRVKCVVEERRVFLPNFVLLKDLLFLHLVGVLDYIAKWAASYLSLNTPAS